MRHLTKGFALAAILALGLGVSACNKGPAQAALTIADDALTAARPELERYAPGEVTSLTQALADAKSQFEKGNYTDALKAAQGLPGRIEAALDLAARKKDEMSGVWKDMALTLPAMVESVTAKVQALAGMKALPKGIEKASVEAAQTELSTITQAWAEAGQAFEGGDVPKAVAAASDIKSKVEALAATFGATVAPPGAAAAK